MSPPAQMPPGRLPPPPGAARPSAGGVLDRLRAERDPLAAADRDQGRGDPRSLLGGVLGRRRDDRTDDRREPPPAPPPVSSRGPARTLPGIPIPPPAPPRTPTAPVGLAGDEPPRPIPSRPQTGPPAATRTRKGRLKISHLLVITLVLVGAVPAALVAREAGRDPALYEIESLALPVVVARDPQDVVFGDRWCLRQCRARERTWNSERSVPETAAAFDQALNDAGWRGFKTAGCPPQGVAGLGSCWQRDEFVLSLYVRTPTCDANPGQAPATDPGAVAAGAPPPAGSCPPAQTTVKIFNRVAFPG
jgi:hypothetical protein